ncbi:hypothetical protein ACTG9Q_18945 [Actinokineospora sp. 24-640]
MTQPEERRSTAQPRHTGITITLLAVLSLLNLLALIVLGLAWSDAADQGGDGLGFVAVAVILQLIAVSGLVAAWFKKLWGAWLYLGLQAFSLLLTLVIAPEALGFQSILPLILAGALAAQCKKAWS